MSNQPSKKNKDILLQVRITPEEKAAFSKAAEIAGASLSSWARERLRRMARRELEEVNLDVPFIKPILPE